MKANVIDETRGLEDCIYDLPEPSAWGLWGEDTGGIVIIVNVFGMDVEVTLTEDEVNELNTSIFTPQHICKYKDCCDPLPTISIDELVEGINVECKCDCCTTCNAPTKEDLF